MPKLPIGQKPYYNIDPVSKALTVANACFDCYIDEAGSVRRRSGLDEFADTATGNPGSGLFYWEAVDKFVAVSGGKIFTVNSVGTVTDISGSVTAADTNIVFAAGNKVDGTPWLYICDGGYPIYTTGSTCARLTSTSGSPASVDWAAWLNGRFLIGEKGTRKFYSSDVNPSSSEIEPDYFLAAENPLTAEKMPDNIARGFSTWDELYVWGTQGVEVWRSDDVWYQPIDGAFSPAGLIAPASVVQADNTIYGLCTVDGGTKRAVVKFNGRTPQVVSLAIERILAAYETVDDAIGFLLGDCNYVLTFPTENVTWVYNYLQDTWLQYSYWSTLFAIRHRYLGQYSCTAWGKTFTQSRIDGKIFQVSNAVFTDNGDTINSEYVSGWIDYDTVDNKQCHCLTIKIKCGDTTSYTDEPHLIVKWRDDGNLEWQREKLVGLGKAGQREFNQKLYSLGTYESRQWAFSLTTDADLCIVSAFEDVEKLSA